jgi:hypothetical protein
MTMKPRKPGSQVAPGQKPLFTDGRTATTHSKVPIAQATAGKIYRVRDKDWVAVWGEHLTWDAATKLKDQVVASGKSRTARVEDMAIPPPAEYLKRLTQEAEDEVGWSHGPGSHEGDAFADLPVTDSPRSRSANAELAANQDARDVLGDGAVTPMPGLGAAFELVGDESQTIPGRGVIFTIPPGHQLIVNAQAVQLPAIVNRGDEVRAVPLDPELARAQAAAVAAVRPVVAASQARAAQKPRAPYRDKTVIPPRRPIQPPPRDKTVSKAPPFVRLGAPPTAPPLPPPSPLKVATELDGEALPDDALGDADLPDLAGDVGGGPSEDDIALAQRQREADERSRAG